MAKVRAREHRAFKLVAIFWLVMFIVAGAWKVAGCQVPTEPGKYTLVEVVETTLVWQDDNALLEDSVWGAVIQPAWSYSWYVDSIEQCDADSVGDSLAWVTEFIYDPSVTAYNLPALVATVDTVKCRWIFGTIWKAESCDLYDTCPTVDGYSTGAVSVQCAVLHGGYVEDSTYVCK